ncbi:MAG: hypothetical protein K8F91_15275 [Candidatus Obscuribacterales bacterium]|nr:hypothetical protein [Candidatus Obscuribacterales bacterium]
MFIRSFGLLIPVVGISYLLAHASQHVVLLAFLCAGLGYLIWKARNAYVRRTKLRQLWRRSVELDHLLKQFDDKTAYSYFVEQSFKLPPQPAQSAQDNMPKWAKGSFPIAMLADRPAQDTGKKEKKIAVG